MLPREDADGRWLSAYIYFNGEMYTPLCDRVVLEVVDPFVRCCVERKWITLYFFIQYNERGAHVRLRLNGKKEALDGEVKPALSRFVEETLADELRAYPEIADRDSPGSVDDELSPVRWVPYEPEIERYGGPEGVLLAEQFFCISSETGIALLKQIKDKERSARLAKGILAMVVLLYAFFENREKAAAAAGYYANSYLSQIKGESGDGDAPLLQAFDNGYARQGGKLADYLNAAWEQLAASESLSPTLDHYYGDLLEIKSRFRLLQENRRLIGGAGILETWEQSTRVIIPSYMHMMNNRLGISIPEESYLAYLLQRTLNATKNVQEQLHP